MKILYLTENHSLANYGVTTVLSSLADSLSARYPDLNLHIATTSAEAVPQSEKVKVSLFPMVPWAKAWGWSPGLYEKLSALMDEYKPDVVHIHGIWLALPLFGLRLVLQKRIPALVSIHGMWEPWLWQDQGLLKRLKYATYLKLFLRKYFKLGVYFHAITQAEEEHIARIVQPFTPEIARIPNAIPVEGAAIPPPADPGKIILYLGRLHPKKGVDLLVRAFHEARLPVEWRLMLAGPEQVPAYVNGLKEAIATLGLGERVAFTGFITGDEKNSLIRKSWIMAVPSYSEVVGMVNLEAGANFLPSITTHATGLADWGDGGGLLIHPNVGELRDSLIEASKWSPAERRARGLRSHKLVCERYSYEAVLPKWKELYERLASA